MLRRVYDILIFAHIIISSPESKYRNDDVMFCKSFLKILAAKIVKKLMAVIILCQKLNIYM
jgi:hypothetical protein